MVIPQDMAPSLKPIFKQLGGQFRRWLEHERMSTLQNLADAKEETLVRQLQGRARLLKELLDQIDVAQ